MLILEKENLMHSWISNSHMFFQVQHMMPSNSSHLMTGLQSANMVSSMQSSTTKQSYTSYKVKGTIHKWHRKFFWIFDTPLHHIGSFLLLNQSVILSDFWPFPPPNCRRRLWTAPKGIYNPVISALILFDQFVSH